MAERNIGRVEEEKQAPRRVIFENQDGTVSYLEGDSARLWNDAVSGAIMIDFVHGASAQKKLKSIEWKEAPTLSDIPPYPTSEGAPKNE